MNVADGKVKIVEILEELQKTGIWIHRIDVNWETVVEGKDVPKPQSQTKAKINLEATL